MMQAMPWILDGAVLVVLVLYIGMGIRRGAVRTIVEFAGFFAALVAAAVVSNAVTGPLFQSMIRPAVMDAMSSALENISAGSGDPLEALTAKMPDFAVRYFESGVLKEKLEQALMLSSAEGAQILTDGVIAPVVQMLLRGLIAIGTFIAAMLLIRVIAGALDLVAKLPVLCQLNKGLGAVCGAAKGLVAVFLLVTAVTVLLPFLPGNDLITTGHIEESMIFQRVAEINPLKDWVEGI